MTMRLVGGRTRHYCGLGDGQGIPEGSIYECDECNRLWIRKTSCDPHWLFVYRWKRISRFRARRRLLPPGGSYPILVAPPSGGQP